MIYFVRLWIAVSALRTDTVLIQRNTAKRIAIHLKMRLVAFDAIFTPPEKERFTMFSLSFGCPFLCPLPHINYELPEAWGHRGEESMCGRSFSECLMKVF